MNVGSVTAPDFSTDPLGWSIHWLSTSGQVYAEFERLVDERLRANPKARISADMVLHVIRWNTDVRADNDVVAINNSSSSLCARLYIARHPHRAGNFETRRSWVDDLSPSDLSRLTFLAARVRPAEPATPLFGGGR